MSRGRNWIFEDCSFRWAGTCGLDVGEMAWYHPPAREGDYGYTPQPGDTPGGGGELEFTTIIRRCVIADNGTVGVWSYGGGRSQLVEDCIFERNNRLGRNTWEEAGIKCHGNTGTVIRNNLFRDGRMKVHLNVGEGLAEPNPEVAEGEYDPRGNDPAAYARLDDVKCEPVEYVTHDYFGQARPKDRPPTAGPIQGLAERAAGEREQWIQLWPNASANRPPAKDLRIDIKPLPFRSVKNEGEWVQP